MIGKYNWNHHLYGKGDSMKKKMLTVVIVVIAVIALVLIGWYVMFVRFGIGPALPFMPVLEMNESEQQTPQTSGGSLTALVDTQEEADEVAEQYGITLVSYESGVAVYHTEENPYDVITRGQENGYHELSVNLTRKLADESQTQ